MNPSFTQYSSIPHHLNRQNIVYPMGNASYPVQQPMMPQGMYPAPSETAPEDSMFSPLAFLYWPFTALGLNFVGNWINKKLFDCAPDKSITTKLSNLGAKIDRPLTPVTTFLSSVGQWCNKNIISRSKILTALTQTPAQAKLAMAKAQAAGAKGLWAQDIHTLLEDMVKKDKSILSKLGISEKFLKQVKSNPAQYADRLQRAIARGAKQGVNFDYKFAQFFPDCLARTGSFNELLNKGSAVNSTKTGLAKLLPKGFISCAEGMTMRMFGGKLMALLQALFIAQAIVATKHAEKGDKTRTFLTEMLHMGTFLITMPLAAKMLYGLGGLRYVGADKNKVKRSQQALMKLNEDIAKGTISKQQIKKQMKNVINPGFADQSKGIIRWFNKIPRAIGTILTLGLNNPNTLVKPNSGKIGAVFSRIKSLSFWKNFGGGSIRFVAFGLIQAFVIGKVIEKIAHILFGKPPEKKQVEVPQMSNYPQQMSNYPQQMSMQTPAYPQAASGINSAAQGNLLQQEILNRQSPQNLAELPRTYIPSPMPAANLVANYQEATPEVSTQLNNAFLRAQMAEESANRFLSSNNFGL